jgi:hypothetical protein
MAYPRAHGLVVIKDGQAGAKTVAVCADVVHGEPRITYTMYSNAQVAIDPEVSVKVTRAGRHTTEIVEVAQDDAGIVQVRRPGPTSAWLKW